MDQDRAQGRELVLCQKETRVSEVDISTDCIAKSKQEKWYANLKFHVV